MLKKMHKTMTQWWRQDISCGTFVAVTAVLFALKLVLVACQMIQIFPQGAPVDDELMFAAAQSIGAGRWLGEYGWATIAKSMGFAVYLAAVHALHIPYLVANALLWAASCLAAAAALAPVFRRRVERLAIVFVLWFSPFATAQFTLRVYRDSILPQLILIAFAGVMGCCLRWEKPLKRQLPWAMLAGFATASCRLVRDDAIWIYPFVGCAMLAWAIWVLKSKDTPGRKLTRITGVAGGFAAVFALLICGYCGMNYKHYGRFILNETNAPEFTAALSAMQMADADLPHGGVAVCKETRQAIYAASPTAAQVGAVLENGEYYHGYGWPEQQEFNSGGFFWAVRRAAFEAGLAGTAQQAKAFYTAIASELHSAYDAGTLTASNSGTLSSFLIPWHDSFLKPTLQEIGSSLRCLLFFEQTGSLAPLSNATIEQAAPWEDYTYTKASNIAKANTSDPYYYPHQVVAEWLFTVIRWCYRILIIPALVLFALAMAAKCKGLFRAPQKWFCSKDGMMAVIMLGLALSSVLRIVLMAYIEATNFRIGTYLLYLSGSAMLTVLCAAIGTAWLLQSLYKRQTEGAVR